MVIHAEDSDDEKRIFKAEKAAERKAKRRKTAAPPRPRAEFTIACNSTGPPQSLFPRRSVPQFYAQAMRPRPAGPCFACGELAHIRSFCLKTPDMSNKKWYPSEYV